jgi:DNA-binding MarR family transcriptional regulator/GNAT superfamily N-acetyltransferase
MDRTLITQVRSFNRAVTSRVGALDEKFLSRGRPLGQARLLWEIGPDGCDVRSLRSRLELDSGYVSRLLRALEADGLVTVGPSARDARIRTARLTRRGQTERAVLDRRSDDTAAAILEPLTARQRDRLVEAMATVERLLAASTVQLAECEPDSAPARSCLQRYYAELSQRFGGGFDATDGGAAGDEMLAPPNGLFLVAMLRSEPVGCAGLIVHHDATAEIKRLWVASSTRGLGLGRRLLTALEERAVARGIGTVRLDTNQALDEAINLYRTAGYHEIAPYNDNPYAHHWFEKDLATG